jgi:hypothetical protein
MVDPRRLVTNPCHCSFDQGNDHALQRRGLGRICNAFGDLCVAVALPGAEEAGLVLTMGNLDTGAAPPALMARAGRNRGRLDDDQRATAVPKASLLYQMPIVHDVVRHLLLAHRRDDDAVLQ